MPWQVITKTLQLGPYHKLKERLTKEFTLAEKMVLRES
jgi:hypothetical protein